MRMCMCMVDRRALLRASTAIGAAILAPTLPALAHAPQGITRAQPSFYRYKLGTVELTVISDGTLEFPAETLWGDRAEHRHIQAQTISVAKPRTRPAHSCDQPALPSLERDFLPPACAKPCRPGQAAARACNWER